MRSAEAGSPQRREREAGARRRLLVLGSGFGGFSLLSHLTLKQFEAVLVSPRNYFLFTPLLPSAATGTVELRSILEPVGRHLAGARLIEARAVGIDWAQRKVHCCAAVGEETFPVAYDLLVLAVGARVADYGIEGVEEHALHLASIEDARRIRVALLDQMARADLPGLEREEVERRLTFVVCGGGPTGVEVAAEIHDLLKEDLSRSYPHLVPIARVILLEASEHLLGSFDRALADYAGRHFQREGIEVMTSSPVKRIGAREVELEDGGKISSEMVIWAGGTAATNLVSEMQDLDKLGGRVVIDDHLRVPGHPGVFALGDCAVYPNRPLPATAQVAQNQGRYLARALAREQRSKTTAPFEFRSLGMLTYIGGGRALADLPHVKWRGRTAWYFWRSVYLTELVSSANKVKVLFDWIKTRLFGRDLSRF